MQNKIEFNLEVARVKELAEIEAEVQKLREIYDNALQALKPFTFKTRPVLCS